MTQKAQRDQRLVTVADLVDAPWNPRTAMGGPAFDELVASIRDSGVLVPIVVRLNEDGVHEVICGHRRVQACRQIGLEAIPAVVHQNLDDDEAQLIALVENVQREDLTPLDEAAAYRKLIERGMTVQQVAETTSRSKSAVYQRLKLLEIDDDVRAMLEAGSMTPAAAAMIASMPDPGMRREATEFAAREAEDYHGVEIGAKFVREMITREYSCNLKKAAFDTSDATLVERGACGECEHRTGNQGDLFGGVGLTESPDMCTDPGCFRAKSAAAATRALAKHAAKGVTCMGPEHTDTIFTSYGEIERRSGFVAATAICYDDPEHRTFKALLKGQEIDPVAAVDARGKVHMLYDGAHAKKVLKAVHGIGQPKAAPKISRKREALESGAQKAATDAVCAAIVINARSPKFEVTDAVWKLIAVTLAQIIPYGPAERAAERRGLNRHEGADALADWLTMQAPTEARALACELIFEGELRDVAEFPDSETAREIERVFGVNVPAVVDEAYSAHIQNATEAEEAERAAKKQGKGRK